MVVPDQRAAQSFIDQDRRLPPFDNLQQYPANTLFHATFLYESIWDIAEHYKQAYWADVRALNIRQPAQWTIATDFVPQMIEFATLASPTVP